MPTIKAKLLARRTTKVAEPKIQRRRRGGMDKEILGAEIGVDHAPAVDICD